ncbi:MAG: hypothetical protein IPP19_15900, partial [Verrucomicrobia bacterium]|nr:hypothetical protein [Verrucomicrobiota bacterium]
ILSGLNALAEGGIFIWQHGGANHHAGHRRRHVLPRHRHDVEPPYPTDSVWLFPRQPPEVRLSARRRGVLKTMYDFGIGNELFPCSSSSASAP